MLKRIMLAAAFAALCAPPSLAATNDCLFDGTCGPRAGADAADPVVVVPDGFKAPRPALGRSGGLVKGAQEGAFLGMLGTLTPATGLMSEGFGRNMSRGADGPRGDNGGGDGYMYGGIALAALLYIPALVIGGLGGLIGGAIGVISPETARRWDAEAFLDGGPRR